MRILTISLAALRNVDKINTTIWRSYFSFFQGEKTANSGLFKDFSTKKKWKRTSQMVGFILSSFLIIMTTTAFKNNKSLTVTSSAFTNNGMIPVKYSCLGQEASPPLTIANIPEGTKSLAIIVHDPDAPRPGGFTHWVIWNIDPVSTTIPENFKNDDEGLNDMGQKGYKGVCPPKGTHHYHFMVYALDVKLNLDKKTDKSALEKVMKGHILAQGDLVGTFDKSYR